MRFPGGKRFTCSLNRLLNFSAADSFERI